MFYFIQYIFKKEGGYKLFTDKNRIKITQYKGIFVFFIIIGLLFLYVMLVSLFYFHRYAMILLIIIVLFFLFLGIYLLVSSLVFKVCLNYDKIILKKLIGFKTKIYSLSYSDISYFLIQYDKDKKYTDILLKKETGEEIEILSFNDIKKENVAQLKVAIKCLNNSLKDNYLFLPNEVKQ